jgi:nucleoside-diphosphate-sugar epimerase
VAFLIGADIQLSKNKAAGSRSSFCERGTALRDFFLFLYGINPNEDAVMRNAVEEDMKKKILITGAAGNIGNKLVNGLNDRYELTLLDRKKLDDKRFIYADLSDYDERWVKYFKGVSRVLHLAANPHTDAIWEELIPNNIDAVLNVCEACVQEKISRLIFASSCHTMKGYMDCNVPKITTDMPPLPGNHYGISKVIGERVCKSYSDRHFLSVICLRIGWVPREGKNLHALDNPWLRSLWLSTRDLIQVFEKAIESKAAGFIVLYAMSQNKGMKWDLSATEKILGYAPRDGLS